ncbi:hypothetical protein C8Q75DRAFT_483323 [Abortiporus biennis]|nr:hypothetical protein C8Q75DRAFT_483323 [Abortiporus biennis]
MSTECTSLLPCHHFIFLYHTFITSVVILYESLVLLSLAAGTRRYLDAFTSRDVDDSDNDFACKTQESENSEVTSASDKWEEFSSEMVEWWLTIRLMSTAAIAATVGALALPEVANNPLLKCLDLVSLTCGACTFVLCIVFANRFSDITFLKSGNQWLQAADDSMERSFLLNAPQLLALPAASMTWTTIFCLIFLTTLFLQITPEPQFALATQIISVVIAISAILHTVFAIVGFYAINKRKIAEIVETIV